MDEQDPQLRRARNQRRTILELLGELPPMLAPGTNFTRALNQLFRQNKRFGSRDRRRYRALVFAYLRFQPWLESMENEPERLLDALIFLASDGPDLDSLRETVTHYDLSEFDPNAPYRTIGKTGTDLESLLPPWVPRHISQVFDKKDLITFFSRPPLWIRAQNQSPEFIVNSISKELNKPLDLLEINATVPDAIRFPADYPVQATQLFQDGAFEIQDISSQILLHLIQPKLSGKWLDACAGAGGKTLQLARLLGANGSVTAYDPRVSALDELAKRGRRARLDNLSITREPPTGADFDGVMVDAPCSGSGTWRRHPYLMRQTAESDIENAAAIQFELLETYSRQVKENGLLVYATCSLSRFENEEVARRFLEGNSTFEHAPLASRFGLEENDLGITVTPAQFDGDGLYIVAFRRATS